MSNFNEFFLILLGFVIFGELLLIYRSIASLLMQVMLCKTILEDIRSNTRK